MTAEQQRQLAQPIVDLYADLTDELMTAIADQLASYGQLTETAKWKAMKLMQSGMFNRRAACIIAKRTGICPDLIVAAVENAAWLAVGEIEQKLQEAARRGIGHDAAIPADTSVMQALLMYQQQAKRACNLVNTVMLYKARDAYTGLVNNIADLVARPEYLQILGKRTGAVATGMQSRQAAVRQCIREFAEKGLPGFVDRAGREWSPEAYINMDIRTTVNNVVHEMQFSRMDAYGFDIIEVSSHAGARPLCAPYQGKLYSRSGKTVYTRDVQGHALVVSPWASTSYGQAAGLLGINCGHQIYPFFPGLSSRTYKPYPAAENAEIYKLSQKQRYYERQVRASKRECTMLDKLGDKEGFAEASLRLKERRNKLSSFLKKTGRTIRDDRMQVVGFNRSVSRKANVSIANSIKSGKLLPKHNRAISDYISASSYHINDALRCGTELNSNEKRIVRDLDSALSLLPDYKGIVYRSMSSSMMDINLFNALHQIGNAISYKAYTSTSKSIYDDSMDVQLVIKAIHAKDISVWNVSEQEVLFGRNSYFIVKNRRGNIIFMEEIEYE